MAQDASIQAGHHLGDFEAASDRPVNYQHTGMRHPLIPHQAQSHTKQPTQLQGPTEEVPSQHVEEHGTRFGSSLSSRLHSAVPDQVQQSRNAGKAPVIIDDSPYNASQSQPGVHKRPGSPSLTHDGTSKRQQTRQNSPAKMSPSRSLSRCPVNSLFGMSMDVDEQEGYLGDQEGYGVEDGYTNRHLHRSGMRSVNGGVRSRRQNTSRPSSAKHTPSHEHVPSARPIPAQQHRSSSRHPTSREYTSTRNNLPDSSQRLHMPQGLSPPKHISSHRNGHRITEDLHRQARAMSVLRKHEHQQVHQEIDSEGHDMEENGFTFVRDPLEYSAKLMRQAVRSQSRPPQREPTVPPESMREQAQYERIDLGNGSRSVRGTTPGHQEPHQRDRSRGPGHHHIEHNRHNLGAASRQQSLRAESIPRQFALDTLGSSDEDSEDNNMTKLLRGSQSNQNDQQRSRQKSVKPYQTPLWLDKTVCGTNQSPKYLDRPETPTHHRQSASDQYGAKILQLDSPIWGAGAERRVTGSVSRAQNPHRRENGTFDGFPDQQRGRSRARTPHQLEHGTSNAFQDDRRGRGRSVAPQTHSQTDGNAEDYMVERRGRSKSAAPTTPGLSRFRALSQYKTSNGSGRTTSQVHETEHAISLSSQLQSPHQNVANDPRNVTTGQEVMGTSQAGRTPRTPREHKNKSQNGFIIDDDSEDEFHTPMDELIRRKQQEAKRAPNVSKTQVNVQKVSSVIPSGSAFNMVKSEPQKVLKRDPATPKSGRGFTEIVDLCTPETVTRSVPMNKRLTPAVKKLTPRKTAAPSGNQTKTAKITAQSKRVPKENTAPVDPEEIRQKRAAEIIIDREQKSDQQTLDLYLFGEIVHDQAAEDKRATETRAKGQREREAKMASMLAKEKAAKEAAEAEQKLRKEEAEKRKRDKEAEEEQKKAKREEERKRREAHEERDKELLRQAALERIKTDREMQAKEEQRRESEKQKAKEMAESIQVEAEELAKRKAKQEQAKLQAASLSSAKLPPAPPPPNPFEEFDDLFGEKDEDSLFMPEAAPVVPDKSKTDDHYTFKGSDSNNSTAQASSFTAMRAEMEAEDICKRLEAARKTQERLGARYNKAPATVNPAPAPTSRIEQPASQPKPGSQPKSGMEKPKPVPAAKSTLAPKPIVVKHTAPPPKAPAPKKDPPAPKPKAQPILKANIAQDMTSDSSRSQSSSASGESALPLTYLQQLAATPMFPGMPTNYSAFARNQVKTAGEQPREYKQKVKLISDLERERLEKIRNNNRNRNRENEKRNLTGEQKRMTAQRAADKRTEKAKQKEIARIRENAAKNGLQISEEEVDKQVEIFLEKRAQNLQKRNEGLARKAQDPGHVFGRNPCSDETSTTAQQLLRDSDQNNGLSHEELQLVQQQRDNQAARRAQGKIRNNAFDRAAARKSVNDFTDSEESEEDPDPEPEVEAEADSENTQQQQSTQNGEEERSSDVESSSDSGSESDSDSVTSYELNASFDSIVAETDLRVRRKKIEALGLGNLVPKEGNYHERMIMIYEVWKTEITNPDDPDENTKREDHITAKFASLEEANAFALERVQKMCRDCEYPKLISGHKNGKFSAAVALDANHECQIHIVEQPVGPSELSPEFLARIPKRKPEFFFDVFQYTTLREVREVNEQTGETIIHKEAPQPRRCGQYAVLEMANHEACEKLIALFRPVGADIEHIKHYQEIIEMARQARDEFNANGVCFEAEVEEDSISAWMPYKSVQLIVQRVELQGPLN